MALPNQAGEWTATGTVNESRLRDSRNPVPGHLVSPGLHRRLPKDPGHLYLVGLVSMLSVALLAPGPRFAFPAGATWVSWTGGLFGAIFIGIAVLMVPRLGAATTLALIVVGQLLASLAFDHFGVLGLPQHAVSPIRLAGAACLIAGVVLVRW